MLNRRTEPFSFLFCAVGFGLLLMCCYVSVFFKTFVRGFCISDLFL